VRRLARRLHPGEVVERRYFENFVQVPEREWRRVFPDPAIVSRRKARAIFESTIARSPALTPGDKILHWDIQTYLTGLFQQDDRMSMANSPRIARADGGSAHRALRAAHELRFEAQGGRHGNGCCGRQYPTSFHRPC